MDKTSLARDGATASLCEFLAALRFKDLPAPVADRIEDLFLDWVAKCRAAGIDKPIIPGIMPIQNYAGFKRMTSMFIRLAVPCLPLFLGLGRGWTIMCHTFASLSLTWVCGPPATQPSARPWCRPRLMRRSSPSRCAALAFPAAASL